MLRGVLIFTHISTNFTQVGKSHTLRAAVLTHSLHTHLCVRTVDKWGDRLNRFENGKTRLFNSRGVVKWAYFQKKCSVPLKADISDLQFRNSLCALIVWYGFEFIVQFSIHLSQIVFILREINGMNEFRSDINDLENCESDCFIHV